jgi:WD40 repeat protein
MNFFRYIWLAVLCVSFAFATPQAESRTEFSTITAANIDDLRQLYVFDMPYDHATGIVFSSDGTLLITVQRSGEVRFWDLYNDGNFLAVLLPSLEICELCTFGSVAISPDGNLIAVSGNEGGIWIWDTTTLEEIATYRGHEGAVRAIEFSPDGKILATGSDDLTIRLWRTDDYGEVALLEGHEGFIFDLDFDQAGNLLASGGGDPYQPMSLDVEPRGDNSLRLWDVDSATQVGVLEGHRISISDIDFHPSDRMLVSASGEENRVRFWNTEQYAELSILEYPGPGSVSFSPDGNLLAITTYNGVVIRDLETNSDVMTLTGHEGSITEVVFSPTGDLIATSSSDLTVRIWGIP